MLDGLFIISLIGTAIQWCKETFSKEIPAENWANKELYYKDLMNGVPVEQRIKNAENGKYRITETYPEPHRDPVSGKIIIENCRLYKEDVRNYGAVQAQQWVRQGKYNLTPEESEAEREYYRAKMQDLYDLL